jgi:hypothetical protein
VGVTFLDKDAVGAKLPTGWPRGLHSTTRNVEDQMANLTHDVTLATPCRGFFGRVAGALALGISGFAAKPLLAQTAAVKSNGPDWSGMLRGPHRQVVDAHEVNSGFPLTFAFHVSGRERSADREF